MTPRACGARIPGPRLLEARWSEGLTNLAKETDSDTADVKSRTFLILGGIRF